MSKSFQKELPELVKAGILTEETAGKIESYYKEKENNEPHRLPAALGIFGALLAGLGIVLLVAHNWDELSKGLKTFLAFLPLVMGQGLCIYTLLRQKQNRVWKEISATLLFFGVGASIALISQVYHIGGLLSDFLLAWMLLTVPLVYIMASSVVSLLYIAGVTWYGCLVGYEMIYGVNAIIPYSYLLLMAVLAPHYYLLYKKGSNFFILHNWVLLISFSCILGAFAPGYPTASGSFSIYMGVAGYLAFFCFAWQVGRTQKFSDVKLFANPFFMIGLAGILFILFWWSYGDVWRTDSYPGVVRRNFFGFTYNYITLFFLSVAAFLLFKSRNSTTGWPEPVGLSILVLAFCFWVIPDKAGSFIDNCWILLIAIWFIRKGAFQNHLGVLNFGLLLIAILALLRFFDDSIPFIWRGLFFLAAGFGFFIANYLVIRKRKTQVKKSVQ